MRLNTEGACKMRRIVEEGSLCLKKVLNFVLTELTGQRE
jgi:hypothetical protein